MSVASQLYKLQDIELEIESDEKARDQLVSRLGDSEAIARVEVEIESAGWHEDELDKQQRAVEWEIDDLTSKLKTVEDEMYSGRISNPKELTNLKHEADVFRAKLNQLEDRDLEIMEQDEAVATNISQLNGQLESMRVEWKRQQRQLKKEISQLEATVARLEQERQQAVAEIDAKAVGVYRELRRKRGNAVARLEQGVCRGCRISLPVTDVQRARSGGVVQCSSCGRILFLA